jgi:ABC-type transport system involved in multi-copper enzyme maturation permease subunit
MGIRLGYWHMGYLLAIPITVCLFALLNATAILAGVVFRHWTLSIVVPIAFWALCTMVAAAKNILDGMRSTPGAQLGITMDRAAEAMDLLYIILPRPGSFAELNSAVINEEFSLGADMFSSISVGPWSMVASAAWTAGCLLVACVVFSRREL